MKETDMTTAMTAPASFEEGLKELETLVRSLEDGKLSLDDALQTFERGTFLRKHCEDILKQAKLKVDTISQNGTVSAVTASQLSASNT